MLDWSRNMNRIKSLSALLVNHAADILAETNSGLSGAEIVRALSAYAIDYNIYIPHPTHSLQAVNKRTALSRKPYGIARRSNVMELFVTFVIIHLQKCTILPRVKN